MGMLGNTDAVAEIIPERDAELVAGVHQIEKCVAAITAAVAVGAAADLALDDVAANVALGAIGVQGNLRPFVSILES